MPSRLLSQMDGREENKFLNWQYHFLKHAHPTSKIPFSCFHINKPVNMIMTIKDNADKIPHATSTMVQICLNNNFNSFQ